MKRNSFVQSSIGLENQCLSDRESRLRLVRSSFGVCLMMFALMALPQVAWSQDTPDYFRQNCTNCHTVGGGDRTGPDLKDVGQRRDAEWLINFMINPRAVVDSGDPYAAKLVEQSRGVVMPSSPGMDRYRAEQILKLIEAESLLEESQFRGVQVSTAPFTDADRAAGRELFVGSRPLENGGAACNSCHTMYDLSALGGGRLGPDLTRVFERLNSRDAMAAWLTAPATETMQPIFKNHPLTSGEIHALTAYFEASAQQSEQSSAAGRVAFLLLGLGLAGALIFLFDALWKGRFFGVRRPLVDAGVARVHNATLPRHHSTANEPVSKFLVADGIDSHATDTRGPS